MQTVWSKNKGGGGEPGLPCRSPGSATAKGGTDEKT